MTKDAFHQAVVGGLTFDGVLTADGPSIVGHTVRGGAYAGGVALVVSGLRRFVPSHFGKGPGTPGQISTQINMHSKEHHTRSVTA